MITIDRFWFSLLVSIVIVVGMIIVSTPLVPLEWRITGSGWAVIFPLSVVAGCHILFPVCDRLSSLIITVSSLCADCAQPMVDDLLVLIMHLGFAIYISHLFSEIFQLRYHNPDMDYACLAACVFPISSSVFIRTIW